MSNEKEIFLRTYSNLPMKTREEVIVTLNGKPITWDVAYKEVKNDTKVGKEILMKLESMGIM